MALNNTIEGERGSLLSFFPLLLIPSKRESQLGTAVLKPHPLLFTFHPGEASGSAKSNSFELKLKKNFF